MTILCCQERVFNGSSSLLDCVPIGSFTPIQRIGLVNCDPIKNTCFDEPCFPFITVFGNMEDESNRRQNDFNSFLFDFPFAGADNYELERYDFSTSTWTQQHLILNNNTYGQLFPIGFDPDYSNRGGFRVDWVKVLANEATYIDDNGGHANYRFVVRNEDEYLDSLCSRPFSLQRFDCNKADRTFKITTNFTGYYPDFHNNDTVFHDLLLMNWDDQCRYVGQFWNQQVEYEVVTENQFNDRKDEVNSIDDFTFEILMAEGIKPNDIQGTNPIIKELYLRLVTYGKHSDTIIVDDFNDQGFVFDNVNITIESSEIVSYPHSRDIKQANITCRTRFNSRKNRC